MAGEWIEKAIGDIAEVIGGSTPSTKDPANFDGDIPWLTPKDLSGPHPRYVRRGERNLSRQGLESCSAQLLPPNAVLLSSRAPIGYVAIAANPIATNQGFRSLVVKPECDHEFLYYWLTANVEELERHASGSTFKELSGTSLKKIRIRLPRDRAEQRAIAHILGTLDDKIELNRRMSETFEAMARALFKSWFVDFDPVRAKAAVRREHSDWTNEQVSRAACPNLKPKIARLFPDSFENSELGEIPRGWRIQRLADVIDIFDSRRVPLSGRQRAERQGPYPYYGAAGVMDSVDDFLFEGVHVLLGEDGSVVKADGRPYTQYVWGKFWVNNHAHVLRGRCITSEILLVFLDQCDVAPFVTGAVQPKLSQGNLKKIPFIDAGNTLLRLFGEIVDPLFAQIRDATEESRTLAALRDALLPKLISGQLRVKDADKFLQERGL